MRLVFAGTPDFAVPSLIAAARRNEVVAVYTQPDRPAGRGRALTPSPIKRAAVERGIEVFQPESLKSQVSRDALAALKPDLLVVVAYGLILPKSILSIPTHGCWNVHASLLPRWRGAAPIQRAIEAGDTGTGVCLMRTEEHPSELQSLQRISYAVFCVKKQNIYSTSNNHSQTQTHLKPIQHY